MSGVRRRSRWGYVLSLMAATGLGLATVPAQAAPLYPTVPAPPLDPAAMVGQIAPSVVDINVQMGYQSAVGAGTGIVLDPNGVVLTNNHVVAGATDIQAVSLGNGQSYAADVIGFDRSHDVAVLQLRGAGGLPPANLGGRASVGEPVVAVGNAGGQGGPPSAVSGRVLSLGETVSAADELTGSTETLSNMIKSDTPIRPGDSGGPLVNGAGQVIGMNTAASDNYKINGQGGDGYAIPIGEALSIANRIRSGAGSATTHVGATGFLGIGVVDHDGPGALVEQVLEGTPAAGMGIAKGDVITSINGAPVNSPTDLTNVLDRNHPGDSVSVAWDGPSGPHTANVVLAPGPVG